MNDSSPRGTAIEAATSAQRSWSMYKRRLFLAIGIVVGLILLANFVSVTLNVLLLLFLCALIALGLRGMTDWLTKHTSLSEKLALGLTILFIVVLLVGLGLLAGSRLLREFSALGDTLQLSLQQVEEQLSQYSWGRQLIEQIPTSAQLEQALIGSNAELFARFTGIFSSVLGLFSSTILIIFISLFLAADPAVYTNNFLRLVPQGSRKRIRETLRQVADTLQMWLLSRCISVLVIGVLTTGGLLLLNSALALSLGIIAGLAAFIPTFGPIIALIPALLVGFIDGPQQMVLVLLLYLAIQMIDNFIITPIVQKKMLYLPPVYLIAAQLLFGIIAGSFGVLLAAPLAAALVVLVRMLYVEDILGDRSESPSSTEQRSEDVF